MQPNRFYNLFVCICVLPLNINARVISGYK